MTTWLVCLLEVLVSMGRSYTSEHAAEAYGCPIEIMIDE
jgi:hypothetical protein